MTIDTPPSQFSCLAPPTSSPVRPTEVPEEDVFVCECRYNEVDKDIRRLKGLRVRPCICVHVNVPTSPSLNNSVLMASHDTSVFHYSMCMLFQEA